MNADWSDLPAVPAREEPGVRERNRESGMHPDSVEIHHAFMEEMRLETERIGAESRASNRAGMLKLERTMCEKFKLLREGRGWSQAELSRRLAEWGIDMHQTTIAKMESGQRPLRVAEMFALSHVFRMPPGAVFFMPFSTVMFEGMAELQAALEQEQARADEMHAMMKDQVEMMISLDVDAQYRRDRLVDLIAASAGRVKTIGEVARELDEFGLKDIPVEQVEAEGWHVNGDMPDSVFDRFFDELPGVERPRG